MTPNNLKLRAVVVLQGRVRSTRLTVVGSGHVGMSLAVLLAQLNDVVVFDG